MNPNNTTTGCAPGCLVSVLVFLGFLLYLLSGTGKWNALHTLVVVGIIYAIIELCKTSKTESAKKKATEDAQMLMLELNRDFTTWRDAQRCTIQEHLAHRACVIQISPKMKKMAVLRYDVSTLTADFQVYQYAELNSWKTEITIESDREFGFFRVSKISKIAVILTVSHNRKQIEHKITLYDGSPQYKSALAAHLEQLNRIRDFLTHIKPETP